MTQWCEIEHSPKGDIIRVLGAWRLRNLPQIQKNLDALSFSSEGLAVVSGSRLEEIDTSGALVLSDFLEEQGEPLNQVALEDFNEAHLNILTLANKCAQPSTPLRPGAKFGFVGKVGHDSLELFQTLKTILRFVGETTLELIHAIARPDLMRWKELAIQLESAGLNAIPIVCLLTFLIGVVIAYLSGVQLERYGANILIVDGVALTMVRELSPILVAIIVAGRSGSAFTAQIGAMKLNEEVDAMVTLGLSPMRVLVVPRLLALMIAMPILVFAGDVAGIMGGMVVADLRLGITGATFIERLHVALWAQTIGVGLIKAPVFGLFIATIGCRMGLAVENNARSVGVNTTGTVVRSIVAVILLNAAFAVVFSELGI